jgi:hypothetical protein
MKNRAAALKFVHVFTKQYRRKGSVETSAIYYDPTRRFVTKPLPLVTAAMTAPIRTTSLCEDVKSTNKMVKSLKQDIDGT